MEIQYSRWYPAIEKRKSRRNFVASQKIESEKLASLEEACQRFQPFPHARSCLVGTPVTEIFRGVVGSYGKIKGAPAFIAFIGNMNGATVQEEVGYTGEGIVLEATALGLNTCWVAGTFQRDSVASIIGIDSNERVLAVTPVGYASKRESLEEKIMIGFARSHRRLPVAKLISDSTRNNMPEWLTSSIQAARLAPSAINRQPWGFDIQDSAVIIYVRTHGPEFSVSKRLDCGISMMHFETAAMSFGVRGKWQFLNSPQVARFDYQLAKDDS